MAKAKEIAYPDHAADPQEWLAAVLRVRFGEVINQRGATIDSDQINGVHDMRVATRRLRSALRDFVEIIDELPVKTVRKELKKLADSLGAVRDHDVAIIALEKLSSETENARISEGIAKLIDERRALRERAYLGLMKTLSVTSIEDLKERFAAAIDAALEHPGLFRPASIEEAGREVIASRLAELFDLAASIYDPSDGKALHKLRIAAKRLRYAIELFAACWGDAVKPFADEIAKMQSHLGEVHDCDEWIKILSKRLRSKRRNADDSEFQASTWLLSEFVKKRSKEYRAALELWSEWEAGKFAKNIRAMISQTIKPLSQP